MRFRIVIGTALLLGTIGIGSAGAVNCKQVNKYLATGRTVKDIAETMVISESDVKKCQEEGGGDAKAGEGKAGEAGGGEAGGEKK
jgi:hypothetical protein